MAVTYDTIVIGGGHNGLVAGNYLARAGLSSVVLEARHVVGGMSGSEALIPGAPDHRINFCALDLIFLKPSGIVEELDLARYGYRQFEMDPLNVYLHAEGASIAFWNNPARTADEMRQFSHQDAQAYLDLMRTLHAILDIADPFITANPMRPGAKAIAKAAAGVARNRSHLKSIGSMVIAPAAQTIAEIFHHPIIRDAIAAQVAMTGPIEADGTSLGLLLFPFTQKFGIRRPVGGTQALPDALAAAYEAAGGTVRLNTLVEQILVTGGRATGVRLVGGEELHARHGIIASCDIHSALGDMLPAGTLSPEMEARVAHIPAAAEGWAHLKVDLALSGRLRIERARREGLDPRSPATAVGSFEGALRAYRMSRGGHVPDDPCMWMSVPTGADPTMAPEGQDTLFLWAAPMPLEPHDTWAGIKEDVAKSMVTRAAGIYDGVEEYEIGRWIESPEDLAARMRTKNGCIYHVDYTLLRLGPLRPAVGLAGYRSPVDRLYLGGAGSPPMGGVTGIPGRNSARVLQRDMKKK